MSNVSGTSIFGSAVVGVLFGAGVGTIVSAVYEKVSGTEEHTATIENVSIALGAALGISICLANNES